MKKKFEKQLEELVKQRVQKPIFYYLNKCIKEDNPITVCLLIQNKICVARGISICALQDQFTKKRGKNKSLRKSYQSFSK